MEVKSGIYAITNKINGKLYVGSSQNIPARIGQHLYLLRKGEHHSQKLQNAWKKYGEDSFVFSVLQECSPAQLFEYEQYWINHYKAASEEGYNIREFAGNARKDGEGRCHMIRLRVNDRELEQLSKAAEEASMNLSDYIRDWIKTLPHPAHAQQTHQDPL